MVYGHGATRLKSFKEAVVSLLGNTFLLGGSVALSIHIVLTFFRMHGLALTLALVGFWLVGVTAYFQWNQQTSKQRPTRKSSTPQEKSRQSAESWRDRQSA